MKFIILLLLFLVQGCKSDKKAEEPPPVDVTIFVVEPKTIPVIFDFVGFAQSSHPVEIRARVEGYLDKIAYEEGQKVKEGDLLFQLDPSQFKAKVEQSKGDVAKQKAILENAKLTVDRLTPLYQQKAASKKDLDNATADLLSAEASLQSAEAQLLDAEINLGYTTITSPISGFADKSNFRVGALISPGANGLLTTVSVLDPIWIYFSISDNDIVRSRQLEAEHRMVMPQAQQTVTVPKQNEWEVEAILGDGTVYPHKGKVNFSSPTYEQSTGTMLARAVFPNPTGDLLPGQFVRIKVYGAQRPNALYVPRRALMQKKDGMYVYLIDDHGKVLAQDVATGEWFEDYEIITNGLKPGDRIIVDGINKVRPGTSVNVKGDWKPQANDKKSSSSS